MTPHIPEILAPAGSADALVAAVRAGADAVYLGASAFSARAGAQNFDLHGLKGAIEYSHIRGVKVYLAVNTLIRGREMDDALLLCQNAAEYGVDAVIVQDLGLIRRLSLMLPSLPLHASTQMTVHSPAGLKALSRLNIRRAVLARELSLEELKACASAAAQLGLEIEVFAHGALCVSVSGSCYFSASLGGYSANRGRCRGACRLPFSASKAGNGCALSLKDLCLLDEVNLLRDTGVSALKIEGRMKRPEYAALSAACYRAAIDSKAMPTEWRAMLRDVFSRGGFTKAYFDGRTGSHMFGVRSEQDKADSARVQNAIHSLYRSERRSVPVRFAAGSEEDMVILRATDGTNITEIAAYATDDRLPADRAAEILQKTGGTPYAVNRVGCGELPLPRETLGAMRRMALERLTARRAVPRSLLPAQYDEPETPPRPDFPYSRVLRAYSAAQLPQNIKPQDLWFVPLAEHARGIAGVTVPAVFAPSDTADRLSRARAAGAMYALCANLDSLTLALAAGLRPVAAPGFNIFNAHSAAQALDLGCHAAVMSVETQAAAFAAGGLPLNFGFWAYGRLPLMTLRVCPFNHAHCGGRSRHGVCGMLSDRKNASFPVFCHVSSRELLADRPVWLADRMPACDFAYFSFTVETRGEISNILEQYTRREMPQGVFTRGMNLKGVL